MNFNRINHWVSLLIPYLWIFILYSRIPREIFRVDKVVFISCCFLLNLSIMLFFSKTKPKIKFPIFNKLYWVVLITINLIPFLTVLYILGFPLNINLPIIISLICGFVFLIISFKFPKFKQNRVVGIKTKWTLKSEKVWNKTHQVGAAAWILAGALFIGNIFATSEFIYVVNVILGLCLVIIVPYLYSFIIWKKEEKTQ